MSDVTGSEWYQQEMAFKALYTKFSDLWSQNRTLVFKRNSRHKQMGAVNACGAPNALSCHLQTKNFKEGRKLLHRILGLFILYDRTASVEDFVHLHAPHVEMGNILPEHSL